MTNLVVYLKMACFYMPIVVTPLLILLFHHIGVFRVNKFRRLHCIILIILFYCSFFWSSYAVPSLNSLIFGQYSGIFGLIGEIEDLTVPFFMIVPFFLMLNHFFKVTVRSRLWSVTVIFVYWVANYMIMRLSF